jgi:hypothetical protein
MVHPVTAVRRTALQATAQVSPVLEAIVAAPTRNLAPIFPRLTGQPFFLTCLDSTRTFTSSIPPFGIVILYVNLIRTSHRPIGHRLQHAYSVGTACFRSQKLRASAASTKFLWPVAVSRILSSHSKRPTSPSISCKSSADAISRLRPQFRLRYRSRACIPCLLVFSLSRMCVWVYININVHVSSSMITL